MDAIDVVAVLQREAVVAVALEKAWSQQQDIAAAGDCHRVGLELEYKQTTFRLALIVLDVCNPFLAERIAKMRHRRAVADLARQLRRYGYTFKRFQRGVYVRAQE